MQASLGELQEPKGAQRLVASLRLDAGHVLAAAGRFAPYPRTGEGRGTGERNMGLGAVSIILLVRFTMCGLCAAIRGQGDRHLPRPSNST